MLRTINGHWIEFPILRRALTEMVSNAAQLQFGREVWQLTPGQLSHRRLLEETHPKLYIVNRYLPERDGFGQKAVQVSGDRIDGCAILRKKHQRHNLNW
ncbi:MAG: hypothetical protein ACK6DZ_00915 [Acidobacteriota bacterium]